MAQRSHRVHLTRLFEYGIYDRDNPSDPRYVAILVLYGLWRLHWTGRKSFQVPMIIGTIRVCGMVSLGNFLVELCPVSKSGGIPTLSISPDGNQVLACGGAGIHTWTRNGQDLPMETPSHLRSKSVYSLAFSSDGNSLTFTDGDHVHIQASQSTRYVSKANHIHQVACSLDGSKSAFGNAKVVWIWDTPQPAARVH